MRCHAYRHPICAPNDKQLTGVKAVHVKRLPTSVNSVGGVTPCREGGPQRRLTDRLGLGAVIGELLEGRGFGFDVKRAVFVSVLHQLFVSGPDRSCEKWPAQYAIDGIEGLRLHHLYRAMAWLGEEPEAPTEGALAPHCVKDAVEEWMLARRRDLFTDLSLVFMDTTTLSFQGAGGETLGAYGHSKDRGLTYTNATSTPNQRPRRLAFGNGASPSTSQYEVWGDPKMKAVKLATALLSIAAIMTTQPLLGQDAVPSANGGSEQDKRKAILIANLAEYGSEHRDPLALLTAASILKRMDAGVARRDGSHNITAESHDEAGLFTVEGLLSKAEDAAANLDDRTRGDVLSMVETLSEGEKSYLGWLHTHYVWWCDPWGYCEYRWMSHY